jgi:hypothetical protein
MLGPGDALSVGARFVSVAADAHRAPAPGPVLGVVVEDPPAIVGRAHLQSTPRALDVGFEDIPEDRRERTTDTSGGSLQPRLAGGIEPNMQR